MRIRCHAGQTSGGLLLSGIRVQEDAESLCNFFREQKLPATIVPLSLPPDYRVFLVGLTMEHFVKFVERANIELI